MGNVSLRTALAIFSQPDDLFIGLTTTGDKWAFNICRGPGHRFKLLLDTTACFTSQEEAIVAIDELLQGVCTAATKALRNPSTASAQILNPANEPLDAANALSDEYRERILADLRTGQCACTYTYKASPRGDA